MCNIDLMDFDCGFHAMKKPKARKQHLCGECGRIINSGEYYFYHSGLWDGEFSSFKECEHCHAASKLLVDYCGGYLFGETLEDLEEHLHPSIPWSNMAARSVVGIRRKWRSFSSGGLMKVPNTQNTKEGFIPHWEQ